LTSKCEKCGNGVGYREIHERIHFMIDNEIIPDDPDPAIRNSLILEVWNEMSFFKNAFIRNMKSDNYKWANKLISLQKIDRELRHVLQPRKRSQKAKLLEKERHEHHVKLLKTPEMSFAPVVKYTHDDVKFDTITKILKIPPVNIKDIKYYQDLCDAFRTTQRENEDAIKTLITKGVID